MCHGGAVIKGERSGFFCAAGGTIRGWGFIARPRLQEGLISGTTAIGRHVVAQVSSLWVRGRDGVFGAVFQLSSSRQMLAERARERQGRNQNKKTKFCLEFAAGVCVISADSSLLCPWKLWRIRALSEKQTTEREYNTARGMMGMLGRRWDGGHGSYRPVGSGFPSVRSAPLGHNGKRRFIGFMNIQEDLCPRTDDQSPPLLPVVMPLMRCTRSHCFSFLGRGG